MSDASTEDYTSAYSDAPFELAQDTIYPSLHAPPAPGFDIKMAVKKEQDRFHQFNLRLALNLS